MTYKKTAGTLVALAMLAVVLTGCSGASSNAGNTTGTRANALKFSECMRANGLSAFPDPDASGALTIDGAVNGSSLDPNSAAWKQAMSACKDLEPAGFAGGNGSVTPQQHAARLKFAQCVRDNGVPDFPDPASDTAPLVDTNRIPSSGTGNGMNILNAAMHTCGSYASAAGINGAH